jgi:hypothetical protein
VKEPQDGGLYVHGVSVIALRGMCCNAERGGVGEAFDHTTTGVTKANA